MSQAKLYLGDCLVEMGRIADESIDAIIADLPYGTTACAWDSVIPFASLWAHFKRVTKPRGAVVLFGSQPFTSALIMSNIEWFKYCWVWEKSMLGDVMNAKNKPLKKHEDIAVFSSGTTANCSDRLMTYNPQGLKKINRVRGNRYRIDGQSAFHPKRPSHQKEFLQENTNYPHSILRFDNGNANSFHPTQKPTDLLAYLIRTYTNPGETVLDCTMGSGSTIVAAVQEGRKAVGIELVESHFNIATRRILDAERAAAGQPKQLIGQTADYSDTPLFATA